MALAIYYYNYKFYYAYIYQVATKGIVQDTRYILQSTTEALRKKVIETIKNNGMKLTDQELETISAVFSDKALVDPFKGLETEYKQEQFIRNNFNYVVSKSRALQPLKLGLTPINSGFHAIPRDW